MELRIDATNAAPASEQVRKHLLAQVSSGALPPGAKLPTVRALAQELGIAVNTAARAYRRLEDDGIIETFGRRGTFVAAQGDVVHRQLQSAAAEFARKAASLDVTQAEAKAAAAAALRAQYGS